MKYIKEFCRYENLIRIVVRSNTYASSLEHVKNLTDVARQDFNVSDGDIDVVKYSGERYKRTYGIEFDVSLDTPIPSNYDEINKLEFVL